MLNIVCGQTGNNELLMFLEKHQWFTAHSKIQQDEDPPVKAKTKKVIDLKGLHYLFSQLSPHEQNGLFVFLHKQACASGPGCLVVLSMK